MIGVVTAIVAGAAMSLQGVFNARLSEKAGLFTSGAFVQLVAAVLAVAAAWIVRDGQVRQLGGNQQGLLARRRARACHYPRR